ncbi:hypothetical protein [Hymenobacter agri]
MVKSFGWVRCIIAIGSLSISHIARGQTLDLTARVDTTQREVKAIYQLVKNYLRAKPDSLYANPYWNAAETNYYFGQHHEKADLAAPFVFFGITARQTFRAYKPTVLSIEPAGNKYVARIILYAETPAKWITDSQWNPPFILRYYAARNDAGEWKLENTWSNVLTQWKTHATPWITFHYPPTFNFSAANALRASAFCDSVVTTLKLPDAKPFDFYVMDSEEELGRLFNIDYWLAYNTGFTQKMYNRTLSGRGREQHLHEFAHMLYHPVNNYFLAEGIATYLGGVDGFTPYQQTLRAVVTDLNKSHPTVRFKDLYSNTFKYALNSYPRYAAGALVYDLVRQKAGLAGFAQLEQSENTYESFLAHFATVMHLRPDKADAFLNEALRKYPMNSAVH